MKGMVANMFNPSSFFKIKQAKDTFINNHPKFPLFLQAVQKDALVAGTIIEIKVTKESGETITTNVKLNDSDIALFHELSNMMK